MTMVLRCSICAVMQGVIHFNLTVKAVQADGRPTRRGAGRIDLCPKCWRKSNEDAAQAPRRPTPRRKRLELVS